MDFQFYYCYGGRTVGETKHTVIIKDVKDQKEAEEVFEQKYRCEVLISITEIETENI